MQKSQRDSHAVTVSIPTMECLRTHSSRELKQLFGIIFLNRVFFCKMF